MRLDLGERALEPDRALAGGGFELLRDAAQRVRPEVPRGAREGVRLGRRRGGVAGGDGRAQPGQQRRQAVAEPQQQAAHGRDVEPEPVDGSGDVEPREGGGVLAGRLRHRRGLGGPALQPAPQRAHEHLAVDGLRDVVVHARRGARVEIALHRVRRHREDRHARVARVLADAPRRLEAVHLRHLDVHEDGRVAARVGPRHLHGLAPVARHVELDPQPGQKLRRDHLVRLVVLGEEGAHAGELAVEGRVVGPAHRVDPRALGLHHGVEERRGGDRLRQEDVDADLGAALLLLPAGVGAHQNQGQLAGLGPGADLRRGLEAVEAGQPPVEEHEAERVARAGPVALLEQAQGLLGRVHRHRRDLPAVEERLQQLPARRRVLDDEHRPLAHALRRPARQRLRARLDAEAPGELEGASPPGLALDGQVPAHQPREAPADGEAEPGAAVAARGRAVGLGEGLEEPRLLLGRDADAGVADGEAQGQLAVRLRRPRRLDPHEHLAAARELERVADEVRHHLAKPQRVPDQAVGHRGQHVHDQLDVLLDHRRAVGLRELLEQAAQAEGRRLQLEPVGLDLREVEQVVQDPEQVAAPTRGRRTRRSEPSPRGPTRARTRAC